jgi:hypothetical protein
MYSINSFHNLVAEAMFQFVQSWPAHILAKLLPNHADDELKFMFSHNILYFPARAAWPDIAWCALKADALTTAKALTGSRRP